jgi:3-carboxy-cis,cis-muconate cycloisomerase
MAESVAMALAAHVGKPEAHRLVERAAAKVSDGGSFADALAADPDVTRHLDRQAIEDALVPDDYLGVSSQFIGRVLAAHAAKESA